MQVIARTVLVLALCASAVVALIDIAAKSRSTDVIVVAGNCDPQVSRCQ